jgi:hypothetical protein
MEHLWKNLLQGLEQALKENFRKFKNQFKGTPVDNVSATSHQEFQQFFIF